MSNHVFSEYFGLPPKDPSMPIEFPLKFNELIDEYTIDNWLEDSSIKECVQYRQRTIYKHEQYEYRVFTCARQKSHHETIRKTKTDIDCKHQIEIRLNTATKDVMITSSHPKHTGHIPGQIQDIQLLRVCQSKRDQIIELFQLGYKAKEIQYTIKTDLMNQVQKNQKNFNLRVNFLQNHRALMPTLKDIQNIINNHKIDNLHKVAKQSSAHKQIE